MKTIKTENIWYYQLAHDSHYIIHVVLYYTKDGKLVTTFQTKSRNKLS